MSQTKQPALSELIAGYLEKQASAQSAGLASPESAEVVPFEAAPVQPVDPQLAWTEALDAVRYLQPDCDPGTWQAPPDWPALVTAHEPALALAFALGNYPQLVRHLNPLLHQSDPASLRLAPGRPVPAPALLEWASEAGRRKEFPQTLLALGCLRLARQFDQADALIKEQGKAPSPWKGAWANEEAALAWHRGDAEQAAEMWRRQPDSVPVHFNRGMSALFLGRTAQARAELEKAVAQLPEDGAWHHLGRLYLTLAQARG